MYLYIMKKIVGIYKITSPSRKIYIGQSRDILFRWNYHYRKLHCKSQCHLYNSLLRYGVDSHKFEILKECSIDELDDTENYYISEYNSTNKDIGLNHREGGNGMVVSESTREKMRQNALGNSNMLGKHHSNETKHLISKNRSGIKPSEETKKKMRMSKLGGIHSNKTKEKMSKANKYTRRIRNIKTNTNHISITRAAIEEKVSQSTIYRGLKDGRYEYVN